MQALSQLSYGPFFADETAAVLTRAPVFRGRMGAVQALKEALRDGASGGPIRPLPRPVRRR